MRRKLAVALPTWECIMQWNEIRSGAAALPYKENVSSGNKATFGMLCQDVSGYCLETSGRPPVPQREIIKMGPTSRVGPGLLAQPGMAWPGRFGTANYGPVASSDPGGTDVRPNPSSVRSIPATLFATPSSDVGHVFRPRSFRILDAFRSGSFRLVLGDFRIRLAGSHQTRNTFGKYW